MINKKLYICITDSCNLACKGCYKILLNPNYPSFINLDIVRKYLKDFIESDKENNLECVFHGGEPFYLYNDNRLQQYIDLIDEFKDNRISWSATTNLIYKITDKHLELFDKFTGKFIKTSWDVDDYRFKNNEQLKVWEDNVRFLIEKGYIVQPIVTVNIQTIKHNPYELLSYFKDFGINIVNFERITETGKASKVKVKPTNREIDDWLYKAYKISKELDMHIPLFDELVAISEGAEPLGCRRRECMQNVRTLNTDGSIGACPNCSDNMNLDELIKLEKTIPNQCKFCKFYKICKGDCCQLKFDETGCPGLTNIYEELLK